MIKLCSVEEVDLGVPNVVFIDEDNFVDSEFSDWEQSYNLEKVVIYRLKTKSGDERWYASQEMCTHAKISLAIGFINEEELSIECAAHGAQFELETGAVLSAPANSPIAVFSIVIKDGSVYLEDKPQKDDGDVSQDEKVIIHDGLNFESFSLEIKNLSVGVSDSVLGSEHASKNILSDISFSIKSGELTVLKGTNGSGKSSFCHALMGNEDYEITSGSILADFAGNQKEITDLPVHEKARMGIFLSPQSPTEIPGVTIQAILDGYGAELDLNVVKEVGLQNIDLKRGIHDGFSGGEKKRAEALLVKQIVPPIVIFDEIDSGLDVEALQVIADTIKYLVQKGSGVVVISHLDELLSKIQPNQTFEIINSKLVQLN